jgi:putative oxidoreductase
MIQGGWMSDGTIMFNGAVMSVLDKLVAANGILKEHGNYKWFTSSDKFVVLKNRIEFAMTYLTMLLSLFFTAGDKFTGIDYFLAKRYVAKI